MFLFSPEQNQKLPTLGFNFFNLFRLDIRIEITLAPASGKWAVLSRESRWKNFLCFLMGGRKGNQWEYKTEYILPSVRAANHFSWLVIGEPVYADLTLEESECL
ncbi:hypothetical protein [Gloeothece verrucosa]|uniref:Uncharacterized protein n=1 Tax=Gloeothece verrucosa (strain PCC 7822) TaxID=497965 RepID=E0UCC4_GLOV7|nr:hypothetical protein [Gloeothece verrucosa]ADN12881.1 hypothetical protein Cyan7822_0861 [Gloeothece verrucosa PCC 7822]